jgi:tRNA uridine 5-carbamoylmethylation protein Kti12
MRIETPNEKTRWDKPLFIVDSQMKTPLEEIEKALSGFKDEPRKENLQLPVNFDFNF